MDSFDKCFKKFYIHVNSLITFVPFIHLLTCMSRDKEVNIFIFIFMQVLITKKYQTVHRYCKYYIVYLYHVIPWNYSHKAGTIYKSMAFWNYRCLIILSWKPKTTIFTPIEVIPDISGISSYSWALCRFLCSVL
jgi:hypothetical protein